MICSRKLFKEIMFLMCARLPIYIIYKHIHMWNQLQLCTTLSNYVLGCVLHNESHNVTVIMYWPKISLTVFLQNSCIIVSCRCLRQTGHSKGLNGFASSACIPVGRPYSTCPRISFSHSFLQLPMSLSFTDTHANCQLGQFKTVNI